MHELYPDLNGILTSYALSGKGQRILPVALWKEWPNNTILKQNKEGIFLEDEIKKLEKIIWYLEEPPKAMGVFSQWHVMELAQNDVTVLLDGQGGDEMLAGYEPYYYSFLDNFNLFNPKLYIEFSKSKVLPYKNIFYYVNTRLKKRTNKMDNGHRINDNLLKKGYRFFNSCSEMPAKRPIS